MRVERWGRFAVLAVIVILSALFTLLNSGERVPVYLGFTVLYRVSLVWLVFGAFLLGMITMMLISLGHDRRIRRALQQRGLLEPPPPPPPPDPGPDPPL